MSILKFVSNAEFGKKMLVGVDSILKIREPLKHIKERKNRAKLLKNTKIPVHNILDKKNNFIPSNMLNYFELSSIVIIGILDNSVFQEYI